MTQILQARLQFYLSFSYHNCLRLHPLTDKAQLQSNYKLHKIKDQTTTYRFHPSRKSDAHTLISAANTTVAALSKRYVTCKEVFFVFSDLIINLYAIIHL